MPESSTLPPVRSRRRTAWITLARLVLLALAAAVTLAPAQPAVHLGCLAVLTLIPGSALAHLLLGESGTKALLADPATRLPLTVVFGAVTLAAAVFALNTAGVPITTTSVATAAALLGAVLVVGQAVRRLPAYGPGATALLRPAMGVILATIVLAGAIGGAIALQIHDKETYTTLTFADQSWLAEPSQPETAGAPVRINWNLRAFGYVPDSQATSLELELDGSPVTDIAVDIGVPSVPSGADQPSELSGSVRFLAPSIPGTHRVSVSVYPRAVGAVGEREPVMLTGWLEVRER